MTPHHIIAKIRESFPELTFVVAYGAPVRANKETIYGVHPLDWSHVLRVLGTWDLLNYKVLNENLYIDKIEYYEIQIKRVVVDLTKSPEWNIENNKDFASLLEGCLTE